MAENDSEHAARARIVKARREKHDSLDLSGLGLTTLWEGLWEIQNLKNLDLSGNKLAVLPSEIGRLNQLVLLFLGSNQLTYLPKEINQLMNLRGFFISNNELDNLQSEIFQLSKLEVLAISGNNLSSIPPEIGQLRNLKIFMISAAEKLGPTFGAQYALDLLRLRYLDGNNTHGINQISTLPNEISNLNNLVSIVANSCKLERLPNGIKQIKNLSEIDFRNTLLPVPPEILEKVDEPKIILDYYFEHIKKALNEVKILVVGQGSVGKTSLVQQILYGTFDPSQTKTEGISINPWMVDSGLKTVEESSSTVNGLSPIRLNIWDFGGQEIMHATHQFFLTKRSLYILVLDSRLTQEENRVEYWLKIIQSFGGESPVLIVGNKTDQHPLDIDRTGLHKKYPNIVGILETSAATGAGIEALKVEVAKQVDILPHVHDLLPETWFTVKSKLQEVGRNKNFITQDEYLSLCVANNVTDEISQHTLIGFLHDLGIVLHFQDDPRLEALGILNPQWVTNGVYKILNSHELFQNQGTLTLPMLNRILNLPEYPSNKHLFIVDMMKKFELCYDIEPDKSFLIPDLLPKDGPFTGEWDGALAFEINYNVLPSSIITRFIVRMNAFVHHTVWRSGVVLKSGGNTALIKADTEDRKIYIRVSGDENTRRDFLSMIRGEFEAIHKTITKIEATERAPLPNYPNADSIDYVFLLQLERYARESFPVNIDGKIVDINVSQLLNGIRPSKQATKIFISYSHQDKSFVKKLSGKLENQGMKVWWDFDSLKGGQDWQKEIERGIKQCDYFLVALTPDAVGSEWVGNEITYASLVQKTIIPLHLKKCDLPIGLIKKQYIDFENQTQKAAIKELLGILKSNNA